MIFFRKYNHMMKSSQQKNNDPIKQSPSLSSSLQENMMQLKTLFTDTPDLVIRKLLIKQTKIEAAVVYLSGINDSNTVYNHVLTPLLFQNYPSDESNFEVSLGHIKTVSNWKDVENSLLKGECILFIDNDYKAYIFDTTRFPKRSLEDSPIESSLTGSHVGFTETGQDNIALIRKQVENRELKIKQYVVGDRGKISISVLYLEDVANKEILKEITKRIEKIDVDAIVNAGELAEYIEDNPYSPFPQLLLTERPDFASQEILQGRFVIVVDRSPSVIVCPVTFDSFFKTTDDYSSRWMVASFIRILRYLAFFFAIFLPAFYIAVISFHFEIIPLELLLSIGVSRERIPFPPYIEAFIMEITLEMLREAGVRLPAKIGQTVGIVGGIVIGQAAVEAGIVSNIMVIVVALTAIASFIIPNYDMAAAIRIIRFPMMILASLYGFVGIIVGLMILLIHFISLESLKVPYSMPITPLRLSDWKDIFIRLPQWSIKKRPKSTLALQIRKSDSSRKDGENEP